MLELLDVAQIHGMDQKLTQFHEDIHKHPEIGQMDAWTYLRAALRQIQCPNCLGRSVTSDGCRYCRGTGKVDDHLLAHPMNVYRIAKDMAGIE